MINLEKEKVLLLHQLLIEETGGESGVREIELLDSALQSAYATFGGKELYPTKIEKAARIGYGLISNHAFVNGNKRMGMYIMLTFLEVNGIHIDFSDEEIINIGISVASGKMKYEDILERLNNAL